MTSFQQVALKANQELKNYIDKNLSLDDYISTNSVGEGGDISANIDLIAENIFKKHLLDFGDIYSEESGLIKSDLNNNYKIILDPLDGSDNFLSGIKYYGTSVALVKDDITIDALIYNLVDGTYFTKQNICSKKLKKQSNLAIFERSYSSPNIAKKLSNMNFKYRSCGAVTLSCVNAYNLQFVLFAGKAREFDFAAVYHICSDLYLYKNDNFLLLCKDKNIFEQIKEKIKE
jgi:myo-inositol-1(or 4)-monophosphatase